MKRNKKLTAQKENGSKEGKAFFFLMTAKTFSGKSWLSELSSQLPKAELFVVVLDSEGKSFAKALSKALEEGFREFSFFRFGVISRKQLARLPEILEVNRRNHLDADFFYGVQGVSPKQRTQKSKSGVTAVRN